MYIFILLKEQPLEWMIFHNFELFHNRRIVIDFINILCLIFGFFILKMKIRGRILMALILIYRMIYVLKWPLNISCVVRAKLSQKVFYHFTIFAIVNKILITKYRRILVFNNFLFKYYQLYRKTASDKNCLFFFIEFWEFFQNFLVPHFLMLVKIVTNAVLKKLIKNFEKILRVLWEENKQFLSLIVFL